MWVMLETVEAQLEREGVKEFTCFSMLVVDCNTNLGQISSYLDYFCS